MKAIFSIFIGLLFSGCSLFGVRSLEEPRYEVLAKEGSFEVRHYNDFIVAKTSMDGDFDEANSTGFRRLFRYISGDNSSKKKIPMTAPVIEESSSKKIPMTAPVFIAKETRSMSFVLPNGFTLENTPLPDNNQIIIEKQASKRVAVLEFSGTLSEENIEAKTEKLSGWIERNSYKSISPSSAAGYDPPWTIPLFRRNEIHIEIE